MREPCSQECGTLTVIAMTLMIFVGVSMAVLAVAEASGTDAPVTFTSVTR